jgi:hypothetical protein
MHDKQYRRTILNTKSPWSVAPRVAAIAIYMHLLNVAERDYARQSDA